MPALKTSVRELARRTYDALHSLDAVVIRCTSGYFLFAVSLSLLLASVGMSDYADINIGFGVLAAFYFLKASGTGAASHWENKARWNVVAWDWVFAAVLRLAVSVLLAVFCVPFNSHGTRTGFWLTIVIYQGLMMLLSLGTGVGQMVGFHRFDLKLRKQRKMEQSVMEDLLKSLD